MKQPIIADSVEFIRQADVSDPLGPETIGIKVDLRKEGCKPRRCGVVMRVWDGLSTETLAQLLGDCKDGLGIWERKVRYGRRIAP